MRARPPLPPGWETIGRVWGAPEPASCGPMRTPVARRLPRWMLAPLLFGCPGPAKDTGPSGPVCADDAPWVYASAGFDLSCGIREGGCVECWGREEWVYRESSGHSSEKSPVDYGELDVPDLAFASLSHVRGPAYLGWDQHACGITLDGELVCWGRKNSYGATTLEVEDAVAVAVEEALTCALDAAGQVTCSDDLAPFTPEDVYTALDSGDYSFGAIDDAGDLLLWDVLAPSTEPPSTLAGPFVDLGVGYPSCALRTDGTLTCFVYVDDPDPFAGAGPTGTYTEVCGGSWNSVCAIRTDGRPECWFLNPWPDDLEVTPPPDVALTQLSCGSYHWCGVTVDGEIACWGLVGSWLDVPP